MSNFAEKARNLSQKATQLKAAMEKAPATVAQIRETIAATTSQLQQLRADVQASAAGLHADSDSSLSAALQEINADLPVYLQAGYEVSEVDLEVSPVERLLVHLYKLEDVHSSMLRSLAGALQSHRTTHAILAALLQARQAAGQVELTNMQQAEVIIGIGPSPVVRLCWHARPASPVPPPVPVTPVETATGSPSLSSYSSSFFERREPPASPAALAPGVGHATAAVDIPVAPEPEPAPVHSSRDLLEKYKTTPHFSKYRR